MSVVEHGAVGTQTTSADAAQAHRVDRFMALGFDLGQSKTLALSRWHELVLCRDGVTRVSNVPLHWLKVKGSLDAGMTHAQAVAIFA